MSDQISEKMARKLAWVVAKYMYHNPDAQPDDVERQINDWRAAGLIKKSALDEARDWCLDTQNMATAYQVDVIQALRTLREKYEAAITEILEERE